MSRPCERQDLGAIVAIWSRWSVDEYGYGHLKVHEYTPDSSDVAGYHCSNCDAYFETGDGIARESIEPTWRRALDHLAVSGQAVA